MKKAKKPLIILPPMPTSLIPRDFATGERRKRHGLKGRI